MRIFLAVMLSLVFAPGANANPVVNRTVVKVKKYKGTVNCGTRNREFAEAHATCHQAMRDFSATHYVYRNTMTYYVMDKDANHWQECADPLCLTKTRHCEGWVRVRCQFDVKTYNHYNITFKAKDACADDKYTFFSVYERDDYTNRYRTETVPRNGYSSYTIRCQEGSWWCWGAWTDDFSWGCGKYCEVRCKDCCKKCDGHYTVDLGSLVCR